MIALTVPSPIGPLTVGAHGGRLIAVRFEDAGDRAQEEELRAAARQLEQYFSGRRRRFELPLDLRAGPFDRRVLAAVAEIRFGERISYGELAARFETRLPPAARLAAVEGELPALRELARGPWPEPAQVLGPVELRSAGEDEDHPWGRLIVAVPRTEGAALARRLQVAQSERAVHKLRPYRVAIDPQALG